MKNNYITTAQLGEMLGLSRVSVFRKIKMGEIKAVKIGRNYAIDKKDLPEILGTKLNQNNTDLVSRAVHKTVKEYGETLRLLGKE
jgi:excisionase family DNA binding protein